MKRVQTVGDQHLSEKGNNSDFGLDRGPSVYNSH
jgi:hypothetical protein